MNNPYTLIHESLMTMRQKMIAHTIVTYSGEILSCNKVAKLMSVTKDQLKHYVADMLQKGLIKYEDKLIKITVGDIEYAIHLKDFDKPLIRRATTVGLRAVYKHFNGDLPTCKDNRVVALMKIYYTTASHYSSYKTWPPSNVAIAKKYRDWKHFVRMLDLIERCGFSQELYIKAQFEHSKEMSKKFRGYKPPIPATLYSKWSTDIYAQYYTELDKTGVNPSKDVSENVIKSYLSHHKQLHKYIKLYSDELLTDMMLVMEGSFSPTYLGVLQSYVHLYCVLGEGEKGKKPLKEKRKEGEWAEKGQNAIKVLRTNVSEFTLKTLETLFQQTSSLYISQKNCEIKAPKNLVPNLKLHQLPEILSNGCELLMKRLNTFTIPDDPTKPEFQFNSFVRAYNLLMKETSIED
jgi:hypothetical protein